MIKVFTTGAGAETAGDFLNSQINKWLESQDWEIEITNIHTNSNRYGWMVIVQYKIISDDPSYL
jgi:hypothetical protein